MEVGDAIVIKIYIIITFYGEIKKHVICSKMILRDA